MRESIQLQGKLTSSFRNAKTSSWVTLLLVVGCGQSVNNGDPEGR